MDKKLRDFRNKNNTIFNFGNSEYYCFNKKGELINSIDTIHMIQYYFNNHSTIDEYDLEQQGFNFDEYNPEHKKIGYFKMIGDFIKNKLSF